MGMVTWAAAAAAGVDALVSSAEAVAAAAVAVGGRNCSLGTMVTTYTRVAADPMAGGTVPEVEALVAWVLTARSLTAAGGTAATVECLAVVVVAVVVVAAAAVVVVAVVS